MEWEVLEEVVLKDEHLAIEQWWQKQRSGVLGPRIINILDFLQSITHILGERRGTEDPEVKWLAHLVE